MIQVSTELDAAETVARETRALLAAVEEHPQATLHLIALTSDAVSFNSLSRQIRQRMKRDSGFSYGASAKLLMLDLVLQISTSSNGQR